MEVRAGIGSSEMGRTMRGSTVKDGVMDGMVD